MKVLIELEKPDGKILDRLAKEQMRSRTAQAKLLLSEALRQSSTKKASETQADGRP